mmetsp:Transcript_15435/g.60322  ORF Transcript_15435/g.60322 Transcript_15435/m.60322 type:complete len:469 (+) Transcript_15435:24-1430(+)
MMGVGARVSLLVLLVCAMGVHARVDDVGPSSTSSSMLRVGSQFGADVGATLDISLHLDTENDEQFGYLVAYTTEQYQRAVYYGDYTCQLASVLRYEFKGDLEVTVQFEEKNLYRLYLLNCFEEPFHLEGTVHWTNPQKGVAEFSLEDQHLYLAGSILLLPLCAVLLMWYSVAFAHMKDLKVVHVLLTISGTATALAQGMRQYYFEIYKATGSASHIVRYTADGVTVIGDSSFLAALLLMAMGWSIVRTRLNVRHKQLLWGATLLYTGFNLAYLLCTYPENLCAVYMLFFVVIKFLILFTMVIALNAECEFIRMDFDPDSERRRELREKLHVFYRLRRLLLALMFIPVFTLVCQFFLLSWEQSWVPTAVNEALYIVSFCIVGYSFRPRQRAHDLLFLRRRHLRRDAADEEVEELNGADAASDEEEDGEEAVERFDQEEFNRAVEPDGILLQELEASAAVDDSEMGEEAV